MKTSIFYTVLSILNLIAFAIVVALLPASVAIRFNGLTVDGLGSAWVYIAFPAVSALLSLAVFVLRFRAKGQKGNVRSIISYVVIGLGAAFACIGWTFAALGSQGAGFGDKVFFPYATVSVLPISFLVIALGFVMPRLTPNHVIGIRTSATLKSESVWNKTHKVSCIPFIVCGILSAVSAVVFSCLNVTPRLDWISAVIAAALLLVTALFGAIYSYCIKDAAQE